MLSSLRDTILRRSTKTINAVGGLLRGLVANPKLTLNSYSQGYRYALRGLQFGREAAFCEWKPAQRIKNPAPANPLASYLDSHHEGPGSLEVEALLRCLSPTL